MLDLSWINSLPEPTRSILIGALGNFAADMAGRLINAGGYAVKKAFAPEPKQKALERAMAQALLVTAHGLTDDPDLFQHYLGLLGEWTAREAVTGELSQVIDPRPDTTLDLALLTEEFEALDYEPELLHEELDFPEVVGRFVAAFYDAAAGEPELQEPIKIGLLRGIAERAEQQVQENRRQNQELKKHTELLEQILVGVRAGDGERSASAGELRQATDQYLRYTVERCQYLDLRGMGVSDRIALRLPLLEMYVPLRARVDLPRGETWARDLHLAGRPLSQDEMEAVGERLSEPLPVIDLLRRDDGLVILGDPGAGKTTFLKYVALLLALGRGEEVGLPGRLPILVPLSAYANALAKGDVPLGEFICDYFRRRGIDGRFEPLLNDVLARGRALLLLDGLDEVRAVEQRKLVVDRVVDFFTTQRALGNRFILTSRIVGYRDVRPVAEGLRECTLVDFDATEIEWFVNKWTAAVERAVSGQTAIAVQDAVRERMELLDAVRRNPGVQRLAANPLLLTILALMKRQGIVLPERRVELYQKYVETLLRHWNLARGLDRSPAPDLDVVETLRVLAPLALWMHETSPGVGLVKQAALQRRLVEIIRERQVTDPEKAARQFLEDVREHTGLLLERGPREYGFIHLTFQEYLAAVALAQQGQQDVAPVVDALAAHIDTETWREVSLLSVAYVGIIQQRDEAASAILLALIERAPGERGAAAVLAGSALLDAGPGGVTAAGRERVIQALNKTMIDRRVAPRLRMDAGLVLGRLDIDPPGLDDFVPALGERSDWGFHIGRYPVTNKQYRRFVEAGGYDVKQPWWTEKGIDEIEKWEGGQWLQGPRWRDDDRFNQPTQPVVGVSWYEANAFCQWLTVELQRQGVLDGSREVRLPTQERWMQAAGKGVYPWGDEFDPAKANTKESDLGQTTPVHMYPDGITREGVWDMAGNIWEWTADVDTDGIPWLKGGAWYWDKERAKSASRNWYYPMNRDYGSGFRVVVVPISRVRS